jgi:hypothetical protein
MDPDVFITIVFVGLVLVVWFGIAAFLISEEHR